MRELSLFSGAGGGLLATQHLLGWRTIGYVEINDYCQRVLRARIDDGFLHDAPIFGDIQAFIDQGYARAYQGMVDVVSGGFPCQPFSVAGKRQADMDERNMWPATLRVIELVRPAYVFLENVPGLLAGSHGYFGMVLGNLALLGYDAPWRVLSAADVGCPAEGRRLWLVATKANQFNGQTWVGVRKEHRGQGALQRSDNRGCSVVEWWDVDAPGGDGRMDTGLAHRVDRLESLGNGQVPALAAAGWRVLTGVEIPGLAQWLIPKTAPRRPH